MINAAEKLSRLDIARELRTLADKIAPGEVPPVPPGPDPVPAADKQAAIINRDLNGQAVPILTACKLTGLSVADACALVEEESGGRNIFEEGTPPAPWDGARVTEPLLQQMVNRPGYKTGDASMWGVGLTQLTWFSFVLEAMALVGGGSLPVNQCRVGFRLLNTYLHKYPRERAFACYNAGDSSNWVNGRPYAREVLALSEEWKRKLGSTVVEPSGLLAHGVRDGTNFAKGHKVLMQLLDHMPYEVWVSGNVPDGPMAWAANRPLPSVADMRGKTCACMGVTNIYRRAAGKIVPTRGNPNFDGGVAAYWYSPASFPGVGVLGPGFFSNVAEPFNLPRAKKWAKDSESGVLIGRSYVGATLAGQGHVAVLLPDGKVMQSYLFGPNGEPGLNDHHTIEESHAGGYYQYMVPSEAWINHGLNQF